MMVVLVVGETVYHITNTVLIIRLAYSPCPYQQPDLHRHLSHVNWPIIVVIFISTTLPCFRGAQDVAPGALTGSTGVVSF